MVFSVAFTCTSWAENNTDYIFNGTTTNFGGALSIPMSSPGTNNSLQIYNGGAVTNAGGAIGLNSGDNFNYAIVSDPGSIWYNSGDYSIGSGGSNNRLVITNQGVATITGYAYIGSTGSTNNFVIVTDPGSVWNIGLRLHPGYAGTQAGLIITNGGTVRAQQTWIGGFTSSSNHTVVVTGTGSLLTNSLQLWIGVYPGSGGNQMSIQAGGRVVASEGIMGYDTGGGNNLVTVSGSGSVWSNTGVLYVGGIAGNNQLILTNGGRAYSGGGSVVGLNLTSHGNTVIVTGSGSRWDVAGGLSDGSQGSNNRLIITGGGVVTSVDGYVGSTGSTNNQLFVSDTGSAWNMSAGFHAGYAGAGSRIVITNGGAVTAAYTYLGEFANSSNTSLTVTGPGSILSNSGTLNIGSVLNTGGNTLTITDGGRVVNSSALIGSVASSPNNIITVAGSGSVWSNTLGVVLGDGSGGNDLKVSDGATVYVGNSLSVGSLGSNNRLLITNGGTVNVAQYAYVGSTGTTNNQVLVDGPGSVWNVGLRLHPGYAGAQASLVVTNGGKVYAQQTWVGGFTSASNNTVLVTGAGSLISNSFDFSIGVYAGSGGNQVTVANGGRIVGATGSVGGDPTGGNNLVTVTDSGSVWSNTSTFYLGRGGSSSNQLLVRNGGTLRSDADINVGYFGPNNRAVVTDPGSLMSAASISVGVYAPNNTLVISNGAQVVTPNLYMGNSTPGSSGSNSVVLVTGVGSVMSNSAATYIGYTGPSNHFIIANGGRVYSGDAYLGYYHNPGIDWIGGNSVAEVTGNGSIWAVAGTLRVGLESYTNLVLVTDGGTLEANTLVTGGSTVSTITNRGGIYQFTTASPSITPGSGAGSVMMSNATVSYRGVVGADINNAQVGNISKTGDNTFQLNNSTNSAIASYAFDSVANTGNPSNYQRLVLVNGGSRWQSSATTIGSGGELLVSNSAAARVAGVVSNAGTIKVVNSMMTFEGSVTISGSYRSDPSTNTFLADVTVTPDGVIRGGAGDVFDFKKSFYIHATNNTSFNLASSAVLFSGGGLHTNAITGRDLGANSLGFSDNFAYGVLRLGSAADQVCFESGNGAVSNALYAQWLDLLSGVNGTNLVANLHSPTNINIYYNVTDYHNSYLTNNNPTGIYQLTDCDGVSLGGFLLPAVPEPSTLLLLMTAAALLVCRKRRLW